MTKEYLTRKGIKRKIKMWNIGAHTSLCAIVAGVGFVFYSATIAPNINPITKPRIVQEYEQGQKILENLNCTKTELKNQVGKLDYPKEVEGLTNIITEFDDYRTSLKNELNEIEEKDTNFKNYQNEIEERGNRFGLNALAGLSITILGVIGFGVAIPKYNNYKDRLKKYKISS